MNRDMKILVNMIIMKYQLQKDKPFIINRNKTTKIFNEEFMLHDDRLYRVSIGTKCLTCRKLSVNDMAQIIGTLLCRDDMTIQYIELRKISLIPENVKDVIRYTIACIGLPYTFWVNYSTKGSSRMCFEAPEQTAIIPLDEKVAHDIHVYMLGCQLKTNLYMSDLLNATTDKYEIRIEE